MHILDVEIKKQENAKSAGLTWLKEFDFEITIRTTSERSFQMSELPLPPVENRSHVLRSVDPASVHPSPINPRIMVEITETSVAGLAAEIADVGQINYAQGEIGADGKTIELLNGLRRAAACKALGISLLVMVHNGLTREQAIALANRDDNQSLPVSFWDRACAWAQMVQDNVLPTEAAVAKALGIDKSTMSRGLAFQAAPKQLFRAFADVREISLSQWSELAPLLENEETRERILERAALLAGKGYGAVRVAAELKAAAAAKDKIEKVEVLNRHGKPIATIQPNHRGGFTISVKPMVEAHPTYRVEYAKAIHDQFVKLIKTWFDRENEGASS